MAEKPRALNLHAHPRGTLLAALVFPIVGAFLTLYLPALKPFPFALNFILIAFMATSGDLLPTLAAVWMSGLARFVANSAVQHRMSYSRADWIRLLVLLISALVVCLLTRSRRSKELNLRGALVILQERTDALVATLHASKCATWSLDLDGGGSARWYEGSYPVFGRPFSEIEALPSLASLLHPDDQARMPPLVEQMRSTRAPIVFEHRVPWPDGELHWLEMRATRVPGPGCIWRGVTVDITERKLAETALLRSEKLAAMGRLAATVAHEINNPLEAVTNLLYLARSEEPSDSPTQRYLEIAEREVARLANITRLSLGFVRSSSLRREVSLPAIADDVLSIFRHRCEMLMVAVERAFAPEVTLVFAAHELRQIVTNLVSNAIDAVSSEWPGAEGGRVKVVIEDAISAGGQPLAILAVEDNGIGIPANQLARIFDPFFTTKQDVGTGIGLWVTRELVERNDGRISVVSGELPGGMKTRFRVELPMAVDEADPAPAALVPYSEASV
jgi:signal transduction histidine kinase